MKDVIGELSKEHPMITFATVCMILAVFDDYWDPICVYGDQPGNCNSFVRFPG